MATDFWVSSHFKRWIVDRQTLRQAREDDLQYVDKPDHLALLGIFFANLILRLATRLNLRQRVIATACVFFRRFYIKNSYCDTDPYLVLAACTYVASKAEESPVHIKNVVLESRNLLADIGIKHFPTDYSKLAEMEFYVMEELECDLVVFHPYRTLMNLVKDSVASAGGTGVEREAGELGNGVEDSQRGQLAMNAGGIQMAWFLINDTFRSDICLLYPPHLIAISALYLTCILQPHTRRAHVEWMEVKQAVLAVAQSQPQATGLSTRRSLRQASSSNSTGTPTSFHGLKQSQPADSGSNTMRKTNAPAQDFIGFFAGLNVNMRTVAMIAQEMIQFYTLCDRLPEDFNPTSHISLPHQPQAQGHTLAGTASFAHRRSSQLQGQSRASSGSQSGSRTSSMTPSGGGSDSVAGDDQGTASNVNSIFLTRLLVKMQSTRETDVSHRSTGQPTAINKMLERAQTAG